MKTKEMFDVIAVSVDPAADAAEAIQQGRVMGWSLLRPEAEPGLEVVGLLGTPRDLVFRVPAGADVGSFGARTVRHLRQGLTADEVAQLLFEERPVAI